MIEFLDKDDTTQELQQQMVDDIEMVSEDEGIVADLSSGTLVLIFVKTFENHFYNWLNLN